MPTSLMGRVLISAASIAGPTLACWLHKYGFGVTAVKRDNAGSGGFPIGFGCRGLQLVKRMGIRSGEKAARIETQNSHRPAEIESMKTMLWRGPLDLLEHTWPI
jgi:2-polyprenyl-6-methoxyphenol hydroxylase-like FAD-dependent oxidoreductase